MNVLKRIGLDKPSSLSGDEKLFHYINLKLAALGCPVVQGRGDQELIEMAASLLSRQRETERLLADYLCPADQRIQQYLTENFGAHGPKLPGKTFVLDRYGLGRALSLPVGKDEFFSDIVSSYRVKQGVLHNPRSDRRTTQGIFHICEQGFPVPDDKIAVPGRVFARLLEHALQPPSALMRLPFTAGQPTEAECFVSLLLRPVVCPEVPAVTAEKTMEIRFFAPGNLVSNLDFVESIFGNGGDPYLPENDAGLDVDHWTGHSGCVILAPHLVSLRKRDLGLPSWNEATERQRRDGLCWRNPEELYNDGLAFKATCRDARGIMVTIIADNYFGYCKKEVKTQISMSANLFGSCEEEHAGGALVYPSYDLAEEFSGHLHVRRMGHSYQEVISLFGEAMDVRPEGYAVDKKFPDILYVSEDVHFDLDKQTLSWPAREGVQKIQMLPGKTYVRPSGYKVHVEKPDGGRAWRLVGTVAEGTLCHKPCTVSGGGKSEISKPITDAVLVGPVFVSDFKKDFDIVAELIGRDYGGRFKDSQRKDQRTILSSERSLGSVIKLLTPASREYTAEYNAWLKSVPQYIKELVFVVKRYYKPDWGKNWRSHFSVDIINGVPGNELKCDNRKLVTTQLRVGFEQDGSWRTFGLRKDFHPAKKLQMEDDISASVVVAANQLSNLSPDYSFPAAKFVKNCEYRLFQRPDDAIHRGYDKKTEADFAQSKNFLSNYEPLSPVRAKEMVNDFIHFERFSEPMQRLIREVAESGSPAWFVSTDQPRLVDGKPTKNPRYLQVRPDLLSPREVYLAEMATRLFRRVPLGEAIYTPVTAVLPGRRNNPADAVAKIRPLCVYNPIHFMELPELFMEFICSMTGKSPSTTGAGSEGALTKGPFNALLPIIDLNNALVSYLLTGHNAFVTAAGHVGPEVRVDHDISLLVPEIWCRMSVTERDPRFLIKEGYLEKCKDSEFEGKKVLASRLGYRITARFVRTFFGRVFNHPHLVFTDKMLRPESQDPAVFADGMENIVSTQQRVAEHYFADGSVELACPPLRALLHIMRSGEFEGKDLQHLKIRSMFSREALLASSWYRDRLAAKQEVDRALWSRHVRYLESFIGKANYSEEARRLEIQERLEVAKRTLNQILSPEYIDLLVGTLGADPSTRDVPRGKAAARPSTATTSEPEVALVK